MELEPGLYYINRWSVSGHGFYSLEVVRGSLPLAIAYGGTVQGTLFGSDDFYLYDFEGRAGDTIDIDMTRTGGAITPMISLWDDSGVKLAEDRNDGLAPGSGDLCLPIDL